VGKETTQTADDHKAAIAELDDVIQKLKTALA
jgi:hypothetical protein